MSNKSTCRGEFHPAFCHQPGLLLVVRGAELVQCADGAAEEATRDRGCRDRRVAVTEAQEREGRAGSSLSNPPAI